MSLVALMLPLCTDLPHPPFPQGVFSLIGVSQDLQKVLVIQTNAYPHKWNNQRKPDQKRIKDQSTSAINAPSLVT